MADPVRFKKILISPLRKATSCILLVTFGLTVGVAPSSAQALLPKGAYLANLPVPGQMLWLTPGFHPPLLKGITVHPENPLLFDFIVDRGQEKINNDRLRDESIKLIKYFLAAMTIPDKDAWVNLSPYEKDRIIPEALGQTEMGRQMLEQDYILKQLAASLTNPDKELGQKFWNEVRSRAQKQFGTTEVPLSTFNKVWIVPNGATVVEKDGFAYIAESQLKVMLDEDYAALSDQKASPEPAAAAGDLSGKDVNKLSSDVFREMILPKLIEEVNTGKNFAQTRQVYQSVILAAWYKKALKDSLLGKIYANKSRIEGVETDVKDIKQKVYDQYLEAFKKGVYNVIKEDSSDSEAVPRKYFSGGLQLGMNLDSDDLKIVRGSSAVNQVIEGINNAGDQIALVAASAAESRREQSWQASALLDDQRADRITEIYQGLYARMGKKYLDPFGNPLSSSPELGTFAPSSLRVTLPILRKFGVGPGKNFVDLGSGDGRVALAAAFLGARAIGVEKDPGLVAIAKEAFMRVAQEINVPWSVGFYREDISQASLQGPGAPDVIYYYQGGGAQVDEAVRKKIMSGTTNRNAILIVSGFAKEYDLFPELKRLTTPDFEEQNWTAVYKVPVASSALKEQFNHPGDKIKPDPNASKFAGELSYRGREILWTLPKTPIELRNKYGERDSFVFQEVADAFDGKSHGNETLFGIVRALNLYPLVNEDISQLTGEGVLRWLYANGILRNVSVGSVPDIYDALKESADQLLQAIVSLNAQASFADFRAKMQDPYSLESDQDPRVAAARFKSIGPAITAIYEKLLQGGRAQYASRDFVTILSLTHIPRSASSGIAVNSDGESMVRLLSDPKFRKTKLAQQRLNWLMAQDPLGAKWEDRYRAMTYDELGAELGVFINGKVDVFYQEPFTKNKAELFKDGVAGFLDVLSFKKYALPDFYDDINLISGDFIFNCLFLGRPGTINYPVLNAEDRENVIRAKAWVREVFTRSGVTPQFIEKLFTSSAASSGVADGDFIGNELGGVVDRILGKFKVTAEGDVLAAVKEGADYIALDAWWRGESGWVKEATAADGSSVFVISQPVLNKLLVKHLQRYPKSVDIFNAMGVRDVQGQITLSPEFVKTVNDEVLYSLPQTPEGDSSSSGVINDEGYIVPTKIPFREMRTVEALTVTAGNKTYSVHYGQLRGRDLTIFWAWEDAGQRIQTYILEGDYRERLDEALKLFETKVNGRVQSRFVGFDPLAGKDYTYHAFYPQGAGQPLWTWLQEGNTAASSEPEITAAHDENILSYASSGIIAAATAGQLHRSPGGAENINYQIEQSAASIEREVRKNGVEQPFIAFVKKLESDQQPQTLNNFSKLLDQADGVGQYLRDKLAELTVLYTSQDLSQSDREAGIQIDFKFILSKVVKEITASAAITSNKEVGGINFDPTLLNLQIKRDGRGVPLPIPQQNLENIDIKGFYPVIINIRPVNAQTLPILGQLQNPASLALSKS